jgi:hypothetical protein
MAIYNEIFDQCFRTLQGTGNKALEGYRRTRYNRAVLALRSQNYFLSCLFFNESGAAGVTGVDRTLPLERPIIIRGGGTNAAIIGNNAPVVDAPSRGSINIKIFRSGSNRAQLSLESMLSTQFLSCGAGQKWEFDWPIPWVLDKNEIIQCNFEQASATDNTDQYYAVNFYGVAVDPQLRCDPSILEDVKEQILKTPIQKPRYLHLKTDQGAGTIVLPTIGSDERAVANTIEVPEHMLILGWRRVIVGMGPHTGAWTPTNVRLVVTGGKAFSRVEIPVHGFEYFTTPDNATFRFAVPHFLQKGASLSLSITSTIETLDEQYMGEIELLAVSV